MHHKGGLGGYQQPSTCLSPAEDLRRALSLSVSTFLNFDYYTLQAALSELKEDYRNDLTIVSFHIYPNLFGQDDVYTRKGIEALDPCKGLDKIFFCVAGMGALVQAPYQAICGAQMPGTGVRAR
jgi:hypothetical protein